MDRREDTVSLALVLTSGCNLACSYCYQNAKSGRRMSWETVRRALEVLLAPGEAELSLAFFGGEPLTQFKLIQRAVECVETSRRSDQEVEYSILTNGTLIGDEEARFLADHAFSVQLSLDGTSAVQAQRGAGTFEVLDRLLEHLKQVYPDWFREKVTVSATILPSTVQHLAEGVEYFLAKEVGSIGFSPAATDSSSWRLDQIEQLVEQFEQILQVSAHHYSGTGQIPVESLRSPPEHDSLRRTSDMCNVEHTDSLTVDVDGEVYGCALFAESFQEFPSDFLRSRLQRMRLGSIFEPDLAENLLSYPAAVADAEIFHHHEKKYSGYGKCCDCEYLGRCSICPVSIGHIPGNTDPHRIPDFLCAFNRVTLQYQDRMAAEPGWLDWIKRAANRGQSGSSDPG